MTLPFIIGQNSITVMVDGVTHTVDNTSPNYNPLLTALRNKDWDSIPELVIVKKSIERLSDGDVVVTTDNVVLYKNQPLHNSLCVRIVDMLNQGFDVAPLTAFLNNLMQNPSNTAITELYDWLSGSKLPITEDGCFLAYKKVRNDYGSFFDSGKTKNEIGTKLPEMPRNMVDDNRHNTCSTGYHFCSLSYLSQYHGGQGRVLILKVNPKDVVSIPSDYQYTKGRATTYEIIGEHTSEQSEAYSVAVVDADGNTINQTGQMPSYMVMGINFKTQERADKVLKLVDAVHARIMSEASMNGDTPSYIPFEVEQKGWNDGWHGNPIDLTYGGRSVREALEWAQNYFTGYDRGVSGETNDPCDDGKDDDYDDCEDEDDCEEDDSYSDIDPAYAAEIDRVKRLPLKYSKFKKTANAGYIVGEQDGIAARSMGVFDISGALEGNEEYRSGYIDGFLDGLNDY